MKNELMKESLYNDLAACVEDMRLLFRDYGFDVEECSDEDDQCERNDPDIHTLHTAYKSMREVLEEAGF